MSETRTRLFNLDRKAAKNGGIPAIATTEAPVKRYGFWEILDMGRCDLSRAPLPFIESHDTAKLNIGIAESVRTDGDKLRCEIRLGTSARAQELKADIEAGIVTGLSIGYSAFDPIDAGEKDGLPVYRFGFLPHEISAVSVAADVNAGFYRSSERNTFMETQNITPREFEESKRISAITALAEKYDLEQLGMRSIAAGLSVADFNAEALKQIDERNAAARTRSQDDGFAGARFAGMPSDNTKYGRALGQYSVVRILRGLGDPRAMAEAGLENEISLDMQRELGRRSKGILMPYDALTMQRAVTVAGSGGNLVGTTHMAGSFVDVLRNASLVMGLGPQVLRGLVGDVDIPRKTAGAVAYWIGGDGSDSITESDMTLDQLQLTPKTVGGAIPFSHKMLIQSSPDIEMLVRQDLADLIATEIDLKAINGTGASNQPLGILATSGIGAIDFGADDPTYAEVVQMETALAEANADRGNLAWLMDPAMAEALKTTPKQASGVEGNFIWGDGRICNIPAYRTANMPAGYMLLGNWQHLIVGFWGGIEIDADPYGSNFLKGSVTVRCLADVDINVRHAGAFCEGHNAP